MRIKKKPLKKEPKAQLKTKSQNNPKQLASLEKEIDQLHGEIKACDQKLADPALYQDSNQDQILKLNEQKQNLQSSLKAKEEKWLKWSED